MKCPNCGETSRIRKKDKFCHKCGRNLKVSTINEMRIPRMKNGADIAMKLKEPVNSNFLLTGKDIFCAVQNEQSSDQQIKNDSEESNISKMRKQYESKIRITEEIDDVIMSVCKKVTDSDFYPGEYGEIVDALANLVKARASL